MSARLAILVFSFAAIGCYPVTQLQGPRTVARGEAQAAVGVGGQFMPGRSGVRGMPLDVGLRVGVLDNLDVSVRARPSLARFSDFTFELGTKYQVLRAQQLELAIAASFVQSVVDRTHFDDEQITPDERATMRFGRLAVLVGTNADAIVSTWIAPTIDVGARTYPIEDKSATAALIATGASAGLGLRLGPHVQLLLQAGVMVGLAGQQRVTLYAMTYPTVLGPSDFVSEVSLGFLFGGFRD